MKKKDNLDLETNSIKSDKFSKDRLKKLKMLANKNKLSTAIVQRKLQCAYPHARNIIDMLKTQNEKKFDPTFFNMDKVNQYNYLYSLIEESCAKRLDEGDAELIDHDFVYVSHMLIMELERIKKSDLVPYFFSCKIYSCNSKNH